MADKPLTDDAELDAFIHRTGKAITGEVLKSADVLRRLDEIATLVVTVTCRGCSQFLRADRQDALGMEWHLLQRVKRSIEARAELVSREASDDRRRTV